MALVHDQLETVAIMTVAVVLPLVFITAMAGVVAVIAVCSPTAGTRRHSLRVLSSLNELVRILRSRR